MEMMTINEAGKNSKSALGMGKRNLQTQKQQDMESTQWVNSLEL